jgi:hypothetical protein
MLAQRTPEATDTMIEEAEVCRSVGRAFRKSIKGEPNKVRASRRDCRYTGALIAIPKEKLRNSRDGAQSRNKAVSRL